MTFSCDLESNFACGSIPLLKKCSKNHWEELNAFCYRSEESPSKKYTADIPASQTNPHVVFMNLWDHFFGRVEESKLLSFENEIEFYLAVFSYGTARTEICNICIFLEHKNSMQKVASILDGAVEYGRFTGIALHICCAGRIY